MLPDVISHIPTTEFAPGIKMKKHWTLSPNAFERLLNWMDGAVSSDGQRYLEMRQRLVGYFDRKGCLNPDELADETLNRVARRLEEEDLTEAETPARYCYIVARFVFLESLRNAGKNVAGIHNVRPEGLGDDAQDPETEYQKQVEEKMLTCLEECSHKLEPLNREIIIRYYEGSARTKIDGRRALAEELGISVNALTIRACRIREKLEICIRKCIGKQ
jgi:DNA-directed RNA polymerase specialized sigma24 family protein